jgi:hypothetical protein
MKKLIFAMLMLGSILINSCTKDITTGSIILNNLSSNYYSVYVNDALTVTLKGYTDTTLTNRPNGTYNIRVVQVTGYLLTPTDKTFKQTVESNTIIVNFP